MPYKEKEIEKMFYGISEVSEMFGVNASLLRFWEREFDTIRPKKTGKGDRLYTKDDIEHLKLIFHLVREKGFTIQGAKEIIRHNKQGAEKNYEAVLSLHRIREFLLELKAGLKNESNEGASEKPNVNTP